MTEASERVRSGPNNLEDPSPPNMPAPPLHPHQLHGRSMVTVTVTDRQAPWRVVPCPLPSWECFCFAVLEALPQKLWFGAPCLSCPFPTKTNVPSWSPPGEERLQAGRRQQEHRVGTGRAHSHLGGSLSLQPRGPKDLWTCWGQSRKGLEAHTSLAPHSRAGATGGDGVLSHHPACSNKGPEFTLGVTPGCSPCLHNAHLPPASG